jgi:hypothetical protein
VINPTVFGVSNVTSFGLLNFRCRQGDQIGLIFVHWMIVYFGKSFENLQKKSKFRGGGGVLFPMIKVMHDFDKKMGLAKLWAIFSANSSGHPAGAIS